MAKSTYLELCKTVRRECRVNGTGPISVTGQVGVLDNIVHWVADVDQEVQGLWFDWDFLHVDDWSINAVINEQDLAAPADIGVWDVESFYIGIWDADLSYYNFILNNENRLTVLNYKKWRRMYKHGAKTATRPHSVVIKPDLSLTLVPPSNFDFAIAADYWKRPYKMTENASVSPIPEEYERIIIAGAKLRYGIAYSVSEMVSMAQAEYADLLDKLEAKYLPNQKARRLSDVGQLIVRCE